MFFGREKMWKKMLHDFVVKSTQKAWWREQRATAEKNGIE